MNTLAGLIILALNLGILALNIKLYTEIFKEQRQNERAKKCEARTLISQIKGE